MINKWDKVYEIADHFLNNYSDHVWEDIHSKHDFGSKFVKTCKRCNLLAKHFLRGGGYKMLKYHHWNFYYNRECVGLLNVSNIYNKLSIRKEFPITCSDIYLLDMQEALV